MGASLWIERTTYTVGGRTPFAEFRQAPPQKQIYFTVKTKEVLAKNKVLRFGLYNES